LTAAGITLLLTSAALMRGASDRPLGVILRTGAVLLTFCLATSYALRILVRVTPKVLYPLLVWLMLTFLLPISIDYVRWWLRGAEPTDWMLGTAAAFGPLGALLEVWTGDARLATPGIVFQAILAAAMAAAYYTTRPRWTGKPVPTPG